MWFGTSALGFQDDSVSTEQLQTYAICGACLIHITSCRHDVPARDGMARSSWNSQGLGFRVQGLGMFRV